MYKKGLFISPCQLLPENTQICKAIQQSTVKAGKKNLRHVYMDFYMPHSCYALFHKQYTEREVVLNTPVQVLFSTSRRDSPWQMKTGSHGHPRSQTAQSFLTFPRTFKVFSQRKMIPLFAYSEPSGREKIYFIDKING